MLLALLPLAFFLYAGISIGCFALRSICNGMALVTVPAVVQLVSFYPVGLLLGGILAMRGTSDLLDAFLHSIDTMSVEQASLFWVSCQWGLKDYGMVQQLVTP